MPQMELPADTRFDSVSFTLHALNVSMMFAILKPQRGVDAVMAVPYFELSFIKSPLPRSVKVNHVYNLKIFCRKLKFKVSGWLLSSSSTRGQQSVEIYWHVACGVMRRLGKKSRKMCICWNVKWTLSMFPCCLWIKCVVHFVWTSSLTRQLQQNEDKEQNRQTSPCCVSIHRFFTREKKTFGILNSKPYSDGTNQVKNNRKQNVCKHPQNVFHLHN